MLIAVILCLSFRVCAEERIIILAPSAADIVRKLGAGDMVVGVTNNVKEFPQARKVGTHLSPGLEVMASLKPSLLITTSRFAPETAQRLGARQFIYDPRDLPGILTAINALAAELGREETGAALVAKLEARLDEIKPVANPPSVMYETRANPLSLAKDNTIIKSVLETAGFRYAYQGSSGVVSVEWLLVNQPDYYIYQIGPMNRNPQHPHDRAGWGDFKACIWAVDEFAFARANTRLFDLVVELNRTLLAENSGENGLLLNKDMELTE